MASVIGPDLSYVVGDTLPVYSDELVDINQVPIPMIGATVNLIVKATDGKQSSVSCAAVIVDAPTAKVQLSPAGVVLLKSYLIRGVRYDAQWKIHYPGTSDDLHIPNTGEYLWFQVSLPLT